MTSALSRCPGNGMENILWYLWIAPIQAPDATTYYLMAVLGARTNNESMLANSLRQAVKLDPSMAAKAAGDLEFKRFNLSTVL